MARWRWRCPPPLVALIAALVPGGVVAAPAAFPDPGAEIAEAWVGVLQFVAEVFGIGLEYGALTVAPWCLNETDAVKTDFGFLGLPPDFPPRSSYYHTQMMSCYLKGRFMKTVSPDPLVKLIGTRTEDRIAVLVMNQDQSAARTISLSLRLGDAPWQADAGLPGVVSLKIPAECTRLYVLDGAGRLLRIITYGVSENLRQLPPHHASFP